VGAENHRTIWVPKNLVPVYVAGGITLASVGAAIGMLIAKESAQDKANSTAADILKHGARCNPAVGPPGLDAQKLAQSCQTYANDNNDINTDATLGNFATGVAAVAFAVTVVYWIASTKRDASSVPNSTLVVPYVGRSSGGISISGSF
jgi:hypothetical protein